MGQAPISEAFLPRDDPLASHSPALFAHAGASVSVLFSFLLSWLRSPERSLCFCAEGLCGTRIQHTLVAQRAVLPCVGCWCSFFFVVMIQMSLMEFRRSFSHSGQALASPQFPYRRGGGSQRRSLSQSADPQTAKGQGGTALHPQANDS